MISERKTCRLCDSTVVKVFELSPTPIANDFKPSPDSNAVRYPLELTQCTECHHVQQRYVVDAQTLYSDYKYATPEAVKPYLEEAAQDLKERFPKAQSVLEIGSNNGLNLEVLRAAGFHAWGVDPAATGDHGLVGYFSSTWPHCKYHLMVANHVFAHIDDLADVFKGIDMALAPEGALVFEVQYLPDLIEKCGFEMIYHEHLDYHTLSPLAKLLKSAHLVMTDVLHTDRQGGSVRIYAQRQGEELQNYDDFIEWPYFAQRVEAKKQGLRAELAGRKVPAFGASAKACTLIHHCEIAENITVCIDDNPLKWGHYIPGTDIKIVESAEGPVLNLSGFNIKRETI